MATIAEKSNEGSGSTDEPITGVLGIERWVQFAYIALALTLFWFIDHVINAVWDVFADPNETIASAAAAISAIVLAAGAYRHPKWGKFSREVAGELSKVTWPSREETWKQTIIVLIVSVIAAIILGIFDSMWMNLTDFIYSA